MDESFRDVISTTINELDISRQAPETNPFSSQYLMAQYVPSIPHRELDITFNGLPNENSTFFLKRFDYVANANLWCPIMKARQFRFYLSNGAADWFDRYYQPCITWFELEQAFRDTFPFRKSNKHSMRALDRCQQPNEDLMTYFHSKMKLITNFADKSFTDDDIVVDIIEGMNAYHKERFAVVKRSINTPEELYKNILEMCRCSSSVSVCQTDDRAIAKPEQRVYSIYKNLQCFRCKAFGHKAKECRQASGVT